MLKMPKKITTRHCFWFSFLLVLILDQISKLFVLRFFPQEVFQSFGIFVGFGLLWVGFFVASVVVFFVLFKRLFFQNRLSALLFGAVIAAAVSNILDKLFWGAILDWIEVFSFKLNIADFVLIIGGIGLIFQLWRDKKWD